MSDSCWNCKYARIEYEELTDCRKGYDNFVDGSGCDEYEEREYYNPWEDISIEEKYRERRGF